MMTTHSEATSPDPPESDFSLSDQIYVPWDWFERGVAALKAMKEANAVRLLVGGARRRLQFELKGRETEEIIEEHSLATWQLRRVLVDLEDILYAAAIDVSASDFARARSDPDRFVDHETEDLHTATRKYEAAIALFDPHDLGRRITLKEAAKTHIPSAFTWEVVRKQADDDESRTNEWPTVAAVLRIASEAPDSSGLMQPGSEVVMTLDAEDVAYMIDSLRRLQEALATSRGISRGSARGRFRPV